MKNIDILIALNLIPKLGSIKIQKLAKRFKSYSSFLKAKPEEFYNIPGIGKTTTTKIMTYRKRIDPNKEVKKAKELGVTILTLLDKDYPEQLKQIYDPPPVIYVKGDNIAFNKNSLAIVGTRKASTYGKNVAMRFSKELVSMNINVVSGMARGIDSYAHKGAIAAGGPTTAVFGCGIDTIYPPENKGLMKKILEYGCVVSSFPLGTPPFAANFPARNRIISGLSLGTLVVEAAGKSGSLITTDFSLEQGREVFAIPGSIFSPYSRGTHGLIKQGAKLVESIDDILDELYLTRHGDNSTESNISLQDLDISEKAVFKLIDYHPVQIEQIINETQKNSQELNVILTRLELKGLITALSGGYFVRN